MTYDELIQKYPMLDVPSHHQIILAAYYAGRVDRLEEQVAHDEERLAKLGIVHSIHLPIVREK